MEKGGYADKGGGRYEDLWALHLLLDMMVGEYESLEREPVGADELGVDIWGNRKDGIRECYQCKAENGDKLGWSLTDLGRSGILRHLKFQLDRSQSRHQFCFVSSTPAPGFSHLCRSARDSRDTRSFFEDQVQASQERTRDFTTFCQAISLSTDSEADCEKARDLLARSRFCYFQNTEDQWRDLRGKIRALVKGEPDLVLRALGDWLRDQLRRQITPPEVKAIVKGWGFRLLTDTTGRLDASIESYVESKITTGQASMIFAKLEAVRQDLEQRGLRLSQRKILQQRWELDTEIGSGGFASVWRARDTKRWSKQQAGQVVAVRILHGDRPHYRDIFLRGAVEVRDLLHESILRVLDGPFEEDDLCFYVTEFMPEGDLSAYIRRSSKEIMGPSHRNQLWNIIRRVGDALTFAHTRGVLHCDVKPSNILLGAGHVRLADFDLARRFAHPGATDGIGLPLGTHPFSAPETSRSASIGITTDVFALAMTIIFTLFGKDLPIEECEKNLPAFIDSLNCPTETRLVLRKATNYDPQARYRTIEEFLACLGPASLSSIRSEHGA